MSIVFDEAHKSWEHTHRNWVFKDHYKDSFSSMLLLFLDVSFKQKPFWKFNYMKSHYIEVLIYIFQGYF